LAVCSCFLAAPSFADTPLNPLDPLSAAEITAAVEAAHAKGYVGDNTYFPVVRLDEPKKHQVMNWQPGETLPRRAFVQVFQDVPPNGATHELIVKLDGQPKVISDQLIPDAQPPVLNTEIFLASQIPLQDPAFQQALISRGYGPETWPGLFCLPLSAGNYHVPIEEGRRLMRVTCLDVASVPNPWSRPIENLTAVVDLISKSVIEMYDFGGTPLSSDNGDYLGIPQAPAAHAIQVQSSGNDYTVTGNNLVSPRWQFHFKVEPRDGLMLSQVKYNDHGNLRSVMYRANLSETFVPYSDPTSNFYYRTYMDEGEYGFGKDSESLIPGKDCPENATFYPATITDDYGSPIEIPNAVCIFEEKTYLEYHHSDIFLNYQEMARTGRNIVVRYATIVGNYDYFFDWSFHDDGTIAFRVGAGGTVETKGQPEAKVQQDISGEDLRWGSLVADHIGAPNHQHIFNVRLDVDVDGTKNTLAQLTPTVVPANYPGSHRTSGWTVVPTVAQREGPIDPLEHTQITVFNAQKHNKVGNTVGYVLESENDTTILMSPDDPPVARAAFGTHELWVTPYDPTEVYAAGVYPYMADGTTDGIQVWTQQHRNVQNTDLVLWANVGFSHITHSENWPQMTTEWFGQFQLTPFNFFDSNPEADLNDAQ